MFKRYRKGGWNPSRLAKGCRLGKRFSSFGRMNRGFLAPDITRREQKYTAKIYRRRCSFAWEELFSQVDRVTTFSVSIFLPYRIFENRAAFGLFSQNTKYSKLNNWYHSGRLNNWYCLVETIGHRSVHFQLSLFHEFILKKLYYNGDNRGIGYHPAIRINFILELVLIDPL